MTTQEKKINLIFIIGLVIGLVGICFVYSVASLMHSPIIGF